MEPVARGPSSMRITLRIRGPLLLRRVLVGLPGLLVGAHALMPGDILQLRQHLLVVPLQGLQVRQKPLMH